MKRGDFFFSSVRLTEYIYIPSALYLPEKHSFLFMDPTPSLLLLPCRATVHSRGNSRKISHLCFYLWRRKKKVQDILFSLIFFRLGRKTRGRKITKKNCSLRFFHVEKALELSTTSHLRSSGRSYSQASLDGVVQARKQFHLSSLCDAFLTLNCWMWWWGQSGREWGK
jgi:hypothetical protein